MGPLHHFVAMEIVAVAEIKGFASFACVATAFSKRFALQASE